MDHVALVAEQTFSRSRTLRVVTGNLKIGDNEDVDPLLRAGYKKNSNGQKISIVGKYQNISNVH